MPRGCLASEHFCHHLEEDLMAHQQQLQVVVTDIRMPFWSMVVSIFKWAIVALPVIAIVTILWGLSARFFASFFEDAWK
jgi:hypothetical protein